MSRLQPTQRLKPSEKARERLDIRIDPVPSDKCRAVIIVACGEQAVLTDPRQVDNGRQQNTQKGAPIMTTNYEHDGEDELQAARRTAHALGQTEGAEQAEVAAELAASPQARQEVEAVEALAARLKEAAREAPQPEPSPALREAIERRLAELEPVAGRAAAAAGPAVVAEPHGGLALTAACLVALRRSCGRSMRLVRGMNAMSPR